MVAERADRAVAITPLDFPHHLGLVSLLTHMTVHRLPSPRGTVAYRIPAPTFHFARSPPVVSYT